MKAAQAYTTLTTDSKVVAFFGSECFTVTTLKARTLAEGFRH